MQDSDADLIITNNKTGTKQVFVYKDNQNFEKLKSAYPDYYEEGCECMIFPYDVWTSIVV